MGPLARAVRSVTVLCLLGVAALPAQFAFAAEEAGKQAEPGIVNLNITTFIQVVNFLILIALLSRFLFSPLKKFLAERAEGIERSLAEARQAHEATLKAQEEHRAQVLAAQREAAAVREQAQRDVETERQRLLAEAREEARRALDEAKAAIEMETKRARTMLRDEVASLSLAAAERILGRAMTGEDQKRLAEEYVRELGGQN